MANLTFSKNGVPMGRNKSTAENKHSAWTLDEDKYIIKSCAENVTAPEMAAKLGRTAMSIYARKSYLGIKNDKSVPRKKRTKTQVKAKSSKRGRPRKNVAEAIYTAPAGLQLFKLESGIPMPTRGERNPEQTAQLRSILQRMEIGNSFVVPKNVVYKATYLANKEFGSYKLRSSATSTDRKWYRIFRVR